MIIEPYSTIPILYQIVDPSDSTLYYIRAVIRDTSTGTTLDTKNLTSQGSGRYTSSYVAPQDSTGLGRHIDISITVYTDSGYSTVSLNYEKIVDKYIIKASVKNFGGGNGGEIDYEKIRKMIISSIQPIIVQLSNNNDEEIISFLKSIKSNISQIISTIVNIKTYEPAQPIDITPILNKIEEKTTYLSKKIDDKEVTEVFEPIDLNPVINATDKIINEVTKNLDAFKSLETELNTRIGTLISDIEIKNKQKEAKIINKVSDLLYHAMNSDQQDETNQPKNDKKSIEMLSPYL